MLLHLVVFWGGGETGLLYQRYGDPVDRVEGASFCDNRETEHGDSEMPLIFQFQNTGMTWPVSCI